MNYLVQISAFDSEGRYTPPDPEEIAADTSLQAAQKLCGTGLVQHGRHDRLAATVWEKGTGNPYPVRFYRAEISA
jgi:hypothetical protein